MSRKVTRRAQSVVPFGVGSIIEFEDEALMPAGLDVWPTAAPVLRDDRLAQRLGVTEFRLPPQKPEKGVDGTGRDNIPYVRFPRWHFCPRCRVLKKASLYADKRPRCDNTETSRRLGTRGSCGQLKQYRRPRMLPLRFIAVCPAGHIEDFPWNAWAHSRQGQDLDRDSGCESAKLYFFPTKSGGLLGLKVSCSVCGAERSLRGATSRDGLRGMTCLGHRPWLGDDAQETCPAPVSENGWPEMFALQRGASNLYFPVVSSSIMIPPFSSRVHRVIREKKVWDTLTSQLVDGKVPANLFQTVAALKHVDAKQLEQAYLMRVRGDDDLAAVDETEFRYAEYQALHSERRDYDDLLTCRPQQLSSYGQQVSGVFSHITLVERLAETRALTGFSRFTPSNTVLARLSVKPQNWLPAFRVHGEGIFLAISEDRLNGFEDSATPRIREHLSRIRDRGRVELEVSRELVLLHTLAHILIKRLSYEAGYGASSIRERIYSAPPGHKHRMSGILLYTAAGDADGTLGGLVGLGRPGALDQVLEGALDEARWCAGDPICIESRGQGPDSVNLAACHACALLPETSCEIQNSLLDRQTVLDFFHV